MTVPVASALFIGEGSSDRPLMDIVADLLLDRDVEVRITAPDLAQVLPNVGHATDRKIAAGMRLFEGLPDLLVVHRDADAAGLEERRHEVAVAASAHAAGVPVVPVIPIRATEGWLLFDDVAIRHVAGKPRGRADLRLPRPRDVEGEADPKHALRSALVVASESTGRRRGMVVKRFPDHRRQLLERLDRAGPVTRLAAFQQLMRDVDVAADHLRARSAR